MREFFFNGDFDETLRGHASRLAGDDPTFLHEMANHFLFAAAPEDSLILHRPLPPDFLDYLAAKGMRLPEISFHPAFRPEAEFTPFGWNAFAVSLNARYRRPAAHPDPDVVRRVNSRTFSRELEVSLDAAEGRADSVSALGRLCADLASLEAHLAAHPSALGWVAKGHHGHAGTANRRIPPGPTDQFLRHDLTLLFHDNAPVALEPWQERLLDLSVNFHLDAQGSVQGLRGHTLINSRDGAFLGVHVAPDSLPPEAWRPSLAATAERVGEALHRVGYFGPVGLDAYVWRGPEGPALRPLVDLNARLSMAQPAHGLARRLAGRHVFWTWSKPRKLRLPVTYGELDDRLGAAGYDPGRGTGILAVAPLAVLGRDGQSYKPRRVAFALVARSQEELDPLRAAYAAALGRPEVPAK